MANGILDAVETAGALVAGVETTTERITESQVVDLRRQLAGANLTAQMLEESLADLELAFEDRGWSRLSAIGQQQFTRAGLENASQMARLMAIANPLIRRGLSLRHAYVWGSGVTIGAKAQGGNDGEQDVNAVIQSFLDDKGTRKALTSAAAKERNEKSLGTDGNLFVALFTAARTGTVQPRIVPFCEVVQVVNNPDDRTEPWFYRRQTLNAKGETVHTYHPDVDYRPALKVNHIGPDTAALTSRLGTLDAGDVMWDAPIAHLKVNDLPEWDFGIGDAFAAIAWARAFKEFLEDWAKLVKALSRFAWKLTAGRKGAADKAVDALRKTPPTDADPRREAALGHDGRPVGQTWANVGASLEAIPKTGATIDSESGKPLASMVAAGMDVPVTMLLADPGQTGARAVAETLDKPTELMAAGRREVWGDFLRQILDYVIDQSVLARQGALRGVVTRDEWGRQVVTLDGDTPRTIDIAWPDLTSTPIDVLLKAIAYADGTEKLPPLLLVRLLLGAFNVADSDEWLAQVTDENGEFKPPTSTPDKFAAGGSGVPSNIAP